MPQPPRRIASHRIAIRLDSNAAFDPTRPVTVRRFDRRSGGPAVEGQKGRRQKAAAGSRQAGSRQQKRRSAEGDARSEARAFIYLSRSRAYTAARSRSLAEPGTLSARRNALGPRREALLVVDPRGPEAQQIRTCHARRDATRDYVDRTYCSTRLGSAALARCSALGARCSDFGVHCAAAAACLAEAKREGAKAAGKVHFEFESEFEFKFKFEGSGRRCVTVACVRRCTVDVRTHQGPPLHTARPRAVCAPAPPSFGGPSVVFSHVLPLPCPPGVPTSPHSPAPQSRARAPRGAPFSHTGVRAHPGP